MTATVDTGAGYTVSATAGAATVAVADDDTGPVTCNTTDAIGKARAAFNWHRDYGTQEVLFWRILNTLGASNMPAKPSGVTEETITVKEVEAVKGGWDGWPPIVTALKCVEGSTTAPPATPEVSITGGSGITEGGDASFTVTANPAPAADLDVSVAVSQTGDYGVATGAQTVTIPTTGSASLTVATTGDGVDEADGSVTATVSTGQGYTVSSSAGSATIAVNDDDVPEVSITGGSGVTEGDDATFTFSASPAPHAPLSVSVAVSQSGDYGVTTGSQTVSVPTSGSATLTVATSDDSADEADGSVTATVDTGTGYTVSSSNGAASVAIADDDDATPATPVVSIAGGSPIMEGGSASFTVTANPAPSSALSVNVSVTQNGDYVTTPGSRTVTIPATGSAVLTVATSDDRVDEADGSVTATVDSGQGYTVSTTAGVATVAVSDDDVPEISISASGDITEGGNASFTLTANPAPHAALSVSASVTQAGDYGVTTGSQTVTIPSSGSATLTVATSDDGTDEADGSVTATVAGGTGYTVSATAGAATVGVADDDDPPPPPDVTISIEDASGPEGGEIYFNVTLSKAVDHEVRVWWETASDYTVDNYAISGRDFWYMGRWLVFEPGETSRTGEVYLEQDDDKESDEIFLVKLSKPEGAAIADGVGIMTIIDDD